MKSLLVEILLCIALLFSQMHSQDKMYHNTFPLSDVSLLDGPLKHARDLNIQTLLKYDVDRLLAPYRKEAGLQAIASSYPNWEGLDGHVGGHYLSAMAMNYAATGNLECKKRMEYMISELMACQDANAIHHPEWGVGYVGGMPKSRLIWSTLKTGDFAAYRGAWAPWYNLHKMYAGLRDAWIYAGNEDAKNIFLKCSFAVTLFAAAAALAQDKVVLKLDLPKPQIVGTPVPINVPNLEPKLQDKRPDFLVPAGTTNLARGKKVTASDNDPTMGSLDLITDGDKEADEGSWIELGPGKQWVQIDLEKAADIYALMVWHFHSQERVYFDVVAQVSDDPKFETGVTTIYNNDSANELGLGAGKDQPYIETYQGKLIDAKGVKGRYVRLYSKGNTTNKLNHYIEVEVFGKPAA